MQSNQVGEIATIIIAAETIPQSWLLKIHMDSQYVINGLTMHLTEWEDNGWIGIKNAPLFKKAAYLLKRRSAPTLFKWVKRHSSDEGNEGSDQLAKEGAEKANPDELNLEIPKEFDLQGAKLATLSQAIAYKGILEQRGPYTRPVTLNNLESAQIAIAEYTQTLETDKTIWRGLQKPMIRIKIRQFLYKAMHETQKIGHFWSHIPGDIASPSAPEITSSYVMTWVRVGVNRARACTIQVASRMIHSVLLDSIEFWTMYSVSLS